MSTKWPLIILVCIGGWVGIVVGVVVDDVVVVSVSALDGVGVFSVVGGLGFGFG